MSEKKMGDVLIRGASSKGTDKVIKAMIEKAEAKEMATAIFEGEIDQEEIKRAITYFYVSPVEKTARTVRTTNEGEIVTEAEAQFYEPEEMKDKKEQ